jgi:uncharacterized membrane protein
LVCFKSGSIRSIIWNTKIFGLPNCSGYGLDHLNTSGVTYYDPYPFILLNLAFSLQAAYAAPLILLAQTQQTKRDLAHALADAKHREDLDEAMAKRQTSSELHSIQIFTLLKQNTELTILIKDMTENRLTDAGISEGSRGLQHIALLSSENKY